MLTKKQLEERLNYIGASEAAGVVGLSRFLTPLEIWAIKTKQIPSLQEESLPMWVGNELEEVIAKRFTLETGKKVRRVNDTIYHKQYPFLACHIDRKVEGEETILQCKSASAWKSDEWKKDEVPIEYIIQEYHELACTGYKKALIACLIGNQKFVIKEIDRDEKIIADLIKKEVYFWNTFVVPKVMPAVISAADGDTLYQLFPKAVGEVNLGDDAEKILESLEGLEEDKKSIEGTIEKQKNELKAMLKDKQAGTTSNYRITWTEQTQRRINSEMLQIEQPEIYQKYLKLVPLRVFRTYRKENGNGKGR